MAYTTPTLFMPRTDWRPATIKREKAVASLGQLQQNNALLGEQLKAREENDELVKQLTGADKLEAPPTLGAMKLMTPADWLAGESPFWTGDELRENEEKQRNFRNAQRGAGGSGGSTPSYGGKGSGYHGGGSGGYGPVKDDKERIGRKPRDPSTTMGSLDEFYALQQGSQGARAYDAFSEGSQADRYSPSKTAQEQAEALHGRGLTLQAGGGKAVRRAMGGSVLPGQRYIVGDLPKHILTDAGATEEEAAYALGLPQDRQMETLSNIMQRTDERKAQQQRTRDAITKDLRPELLVTASGVQPVGTAGPEVIRPQQPGVILPNPQTVAEVTQSPFDLAYAADAAEGRAPGTTAREWRTFKQSPMYLEQVFKEAGQVRDESRAEQADIRREGRSAETRKKETEGDREYQRRVRDEDMGAMLQGYGTMLQQHVAEGHLTPEQLALYDRAKDPKAQANIGRMLMDFGNEGRASKATLEKEKQRLQIQADWDAAHPDKLTQEEIPGTGYANQFRNGQYVGTIPIAEKSQPTLTPQQLAEYGMKPSYAKVGGVNFTAKQEGPPRTRTNYDTSGLPVLEEWNGTSWSVVPPAGTVQQPPPSVPPAAKAPAPAPVAKPTAPEAPYNPYR